MDSPTVFPTRSGSIDRCERHRRMAWICAAFAAAAMVTTGCTRVNAEPTPTPRTAEPQVHRLSRPASPSAVDLARVRVVELGRSVEGRPLLMHVFGEGDDTVFIFGGIHGSEPTSASVAHRLIEHLRNHPEARAGRRVAILAEANPDGLAAGRRVNAHGVDLNRNFPARNWRLAGGDDRRHGPAPASEPETRAIIRVVNMLDPDCIISIHSIARGRHCNNYDGPAEDIAAAMTRLNGYPALATMGYETPGSFGSWAGIDRGIPTITLELPRDLSGSQCWRENHAALLAVIQTRAPYLGE
jgi:protein MpaA